MTTASDTAKRIADAIQAFYPTKPKMSKDYRACAAVLENIERIVQECVDVACGKLAIEVGSKAAEALVLLASQNKRMAALEALLDDVGHVFPDLRDCAPDCVACKWDAMKKGGDV